MRLLLSGEQMKAADEYTQRQIGIPSIVLMERAALAIADHISAGITAPENGRPLRVAVLCGRGNNGADAAAAGRILRERGAEVSYYVFDDTPAEGTNLAIQEQIVRAYGDPLLVFKSAADETVTDGGGALEQLRTAYEDVYVDGIFGIGLTRTVSDIYRQVIETLNDASARNHAAVYAVDIPSGIHAGNGMVMGAAVRATTTVTFGFAKRGLYLYPGASFCGHVIIADIGIPVWSHSEPAWFTYEEETADDLLPERSASGNKGTFGKALIIAGSYSMSGAATMAASAAGRMGCGMVRVFTRQENRVIMQETVPEALLSVWSPEDMEGAAAQLTTDLGWCNVAAFGPGIGRTKEAAQLLRILLQNAGNRVRHIILDADAFWLIAHHDEYALLRKAGGQTDLILTPHLAECAMLLGVTVGELAADPEPQLRAFAEKYHVTILCKDARSMAVCAGDARTYLNTSGNDGLATAGSGDVLAGMLTACTAQGLYGLDAAAAASYLHGRVAEHVEQETGRRGLVAPDLYKKLSGAAAVVWSEDFTFDNERDI